MKTITAVDEKNFFGQLLETALNEPLAATKNRRSENQAMTCCCGVFASVADAFLPR